jgi:uncharacterized protein (UPF0276 family)
LVGSGSEPGGRELGVGLVYWSALAPLFEAGPETVAVLELEPQTLWEKVAPAGGWRYRLNQTLLDQVAGHSQAKLLHGIGQPLGAGTPDPLEHVPLLRQSVDQLDPAWVSEHLSFNRVQTRHGVAEAGFLLPPLQSAASVRVAASNITGYRRALERPVAFETGVNYLRARDDEMDDGSFFGAVAKEADCGILLDLHNLWCNEVNGRDRVTEVLARLPLERVWEVHLAGGMPFSGYRLDAHSGLVPEPLMEIAAEVMPRLPNAGALIFEILPEHVPAVGLDGVHRQLQALRALWELRPPRTLRDRPSSTPAVSRDPDADDLAEVRAWEAALVAALRGTHTVETPFGELLHGDPGLPIFRQLVDDFRRSALARTLRYTMTALLLGLGKRETHELLDSYFASRQPDPYAAVEAHHFACFLLERPHLLERVRYSSELLQFEHALVKATVFGVSSDVQWTVDPTSILEALDRGRLPAELPTTTSTMRVDPGPRCGVAGPGFEPG